MKRICASLVLLLSSTASLADVLEAKTLKLFEIQGVVSTYQAAIDQGRAQAKEDTKKTLDQMLSQLNPPKEFQDQMRLAAEKYVATLQGVRNAAEIVNTLIKIYAPQFTEQELDKLIVFYGSSVGKKDVAVSKSSMQQVVDYYKADNEKIRVSATNEFARDLQRIAQQCNCGKQEKMPNK